MSLFSSLNLARLALGAHQTALQTIGQNIANAGTEGYARQRVQFTPTPASDLVFARLGTGVRVQRIERIVDEHLESTLRDAKTGLADLNERSRMVSLAESIFNDLEGGGLSNAIGRFFDALEDLANQPQDATARSILLQEGQSLAEGFNFMDARIRDLRSGLDEGVVTVVDEINVITSELADLNRQILIAEDGGLQPNTANDLRTRRDFLLGQLAERIDIRTIQNDRGAVQVVSGNEALVFGNHSRTLELVPTSDGDISLHNIRIAETGQRFAPDGGRLGALLDGRDRLARDLRSDLDTVAMGFLRDVNAIHSGGEGLARFTEVRSAYSATSYSGPVAGGSVYSLPVETGTFEFQVVNEGDGTRETYTITIEAGTSIEGIAGRINQQVSADHPEISATVTNDGYLEIASSSETLTFTFRNDNTGFLVAAGINTLFTGTNAREMSVSAQLLDNPSLLSTGLGAGSGDNRVVLEMLALRDAGILGSDSRTIEEYYSATVGKVGIEGAQVNELLRNQDAITNQLANQREALSGVNIDEEAIALVQSQRAFQGAARFLNIVDRLLETLINSV